MAKSKTREPAPEPERPRAIWIPNHSQRLARAREAVEQDAKMAELEAHADALGVRPAAEGRTTKAELKQAIIEAADTTTRTEG